MKINFKIIFVSLIFQKKIMYVNYASEYLCLLFVKAMLLLMD